MPREVFIPKLPEVGNSRSQGVLSVSSGESFRLSHYESEFKEQALGPQHLGDAALACMGMGRRPLVNTNLMSWASRELLLVGGTWPRSQ